MPAFTRRDLGEAFAEREMPTLNERLKAWRAIQKLTQGQAASLFGIPTSSFVKYETGRSAPGADVMEAFARAGINVNWLLTGEGPMRLADLADATRGPDTLDRERMSLAIETITRGLQKANAKVAPEKIGSLLLAVYDYLEEEGATETTVANIIRLAA